MKWIELKNPTNVLLVLILLTNIWLISTVQSTAKDMRLSISGYIDRASGEIQNELEKLRYGI